MSLGQYEMAHINLFCPFIICIQNFKVNYNFYKYIFSPLVNPYNCIIKIHKTHKILNNKQFNS